MGRMILGVPNVLDRINTFDVSLGSWGSNTANYNILDPRFASVARSTDATTTSTQFAFDLNSAAVLGNPPGAQMFAIPKHNLTKAATIRIKGGTSAFTSGGAGGGTIAYDSTAVAAIPTIVYPSGTLPWGHVSGWSLEDDPVMDAGYNKAVVVLFGSTIAARYWWVGITDAANPDGYVELARAFLGPIFQPSINFAVGANIAFDGERVAATSIGNVEYADRLSLRRLISITLDNLPESESMSYLPAIATYLGYDRQAFFMWDDADTTYILRRSCMVTLRSPGTMTANEGSFMTTPMVFAEVL